MVVLFDQFEGVDFFSEDFLTLEENQLERIMLSDDLNVSREGIVAKALLAWVSHDVNARTNYFRRKFVRLLRIPLVCLPKLICICPIYFLQWVTGC